MAVTPEELVRTGLEQSIERRISGITLIPEVFRESVLEYPTNYYGIPVIGRTLINVLGDLARVIDYLPDHHPELRGGIGINGLTGPETMIPRTIHKDAISGKPFKDPLLDP